MPNFAIVEKGIVTNTILAESRAIAEEITGNAGKGYGSGGGGAPGVVYIYRF
jgi:hypothetical protein